MKYRLLKWAGEVCYRLFFSFKGHESDVKRTHPHTVNLKTLTRPWIRLSLCILDVCVFI